MRPQHREREKVIAVVKQGRGALEAPIAEERDQLARQNTTWAVKKLILALNRLFDQ